MAVTPSYAVTGLLIPQDKYGTPMASNKEKQEKQITAIREKLELSLRKLYRLDRVAGEAAALYCIIQIQHLIITLRDHH
jgi:hypothetical protein